MALPIGEPLSKSAEVRLELFFDNWKKKKLIHTASLQTYKLLAELTAVSTGTVIDLGSGFASVVMHEFNPNDCKVVSVSTSKAELDKVANFIDFEEELISWKVFKDKMYMDATLIFFNIGTPAARLNYFPSVFKKYLTHTGVGIVFNDMHKPTLLVGLQSGLKGFSHKGHDIRGLTEDEYGRYCLMVEGV